MKKLLESLVEKNKVYIYGGTYNDCIVGGESRKGNANYNEIIIGDNKDIEKNNYRILINKSLNKYKEKFDNYDINNIIGTKIDYILPSSFYQKNMAEYIKKGNILLLDKGIRKSNSKVCETFKAIINDIDKEVHKLEKIN